MEEAVTTPDEDLVKYFCDTKKTAMKQSDIVTISSVTEAQVIVKDFTSRKNMFGESSLSGIQPSVAEKNMYPMMMV